VELVEEILTREACLKDERRLLDSLIHTVNRNVTAYDYEPDTETLPGMERGQGILDGTALDGLSTAVNTIIGAMVPADTRNFSLVPEDENLKNNNAVMKWYDDASNIIYRALATSNLRSIAHPVIHDLYAKGTGNMLMSNAGDLSKLIFRAYPIGSYCVAENDEGTVDTVYQRTKMTVRNLEAMRRRLGRNATLHEAVRKRLSEGKGLDDKITILHAVEPRMNAEYKPTAHPKKRPYRAVWLDVDNRHNIFEGGHFHCPYKVSRWMQIPGFPYGLSPLMNVLSDVKTLNKLKEYAFRSIAKAIDPPMKGSSREDFWKKGRKFRLIPGDFIPLRDMNGLAAIEQGTRVDVADFAIKEIQIAIQKGLGVDRMQIEPASGDTQRSATEIAHRIATNNRQLGPGLTKLEDEWMEPTVLYAFYLLGEARKIPPPPDIIYGENGKGDGRSFLDIAVRFEGSLARQSRQVDIQAIMDFFNLLAFVKQVHPMADDNFLLDYYIRQIPQALGLNQAGMRPYGEEVEAITVQDLRAEREKQAQAQQQAAALFQAAELATKVPQPKPEAVRAA
jgi:hypothetical protein